MPKQTIECRNCNQYFEAHFPYCPYCGQEAEDRLTLGVLFTNTINNYFSVDARFFRSFWPLMTKPGYLARKFVQGKRLLFIHPAQMYLFVSIVFFFLLSFISRDQSNSLDSALKDADSKIKVSLDSIQQRKADSLATQRFLNPLQENKKSLGLEDEDIVQMDSIFNKKGAPKATIYGVHFNKAEIDSMLEIGASDQKIYKFLGMKNSDGMFKKRVYSQGLKFYKSKSGGSILQAFYDSIPIAMFLLLPIFALILKLFYFNKGRFVHHLIFTFYFFSFLFIVFGILTLTSIIWDDFPGWISFLIMLSTFVYLVIGVKRFYHENYLLSFVKSNVISFLFLSFVVPFAAIIMAFSAFLFY